MTVMFRLGCALFLTALLWSFAALAAEPAAKREVAAAPDWSKSVADWQARAERGDRAAPAELCELFFDGRGGGFDPNATLDWCRRAAELGNAAADLRLGLLSLAGVGARKDLAAAATQCSEAQARNAAISAGFCLAAVAEEKRRGDRAAGVAEPYSATANGTATAQSTSVANLGEWRNQAQRGDRAATARLCEFYFGALHPAFEPAQAAEWCRRAARSGDAAAFRRLGLMRLWGVGIEKSTPQAEALCLEAQALDPAVSAAYCVAAVRQEYASNAAALAPSHVAKPAVTPQAGDRVSASDTLGFDRVLASVHATPTGLQFSCRDILRWARYETLDGLNIVSSATLAFGRSILDYEDKDYAALDHAAADCAAAIAPYDEDGSTRFQLAQFRKMLPLIKVRQGEVDREKLVNQTDVPRCLEALRRSRADTQRLVPGAPGGAGQWSDTYECTRSGRWQPQGRNTAPPRAAAERAAVGGR
jgi:TPR repeat protein